MLGDVDRVLQDFLRGGSPLRGHSPRSHVDPPTSSGLQYPNSNATTTPLIVVPSITPVREVYIPRPSNSGTDDETLLTKRGTVGLSNLLSLDAENCLIESGALVYDVIAEGLDPVSRQGDRQSGNSLTSTHNYTTDASTRSQQPQTSATVAAVDVSELYCRQKAEISRRQKTNVARQRVQEKKQKAYLELESFLSKLEHGRSMKGISTDREDDSTIAPRENLRNDASVTDDQVFQRVRQVLSSAEMSSRFNSLEPTFSSLSPLSRERLHRAALEKLLNDEEDSIAEPSRRNCKFLTETLPCVLPLPPRSRLRPSMPRATSPRLIRQDPPSIRAGSTLKPVVTPSIQPLPSPKIAIQVNSVLEDESTLTTGEDCSTRCEEKSHSQRRRSPSPRSRDARFRKMQAAKLGRVPRPRPEDTLLTSSRPCRLRPNTGRRSTRQNGGATLTSNRTSTGLGQYFSRAGHQSKRQQPGEAPNSTFQLQMMQAVKVSPTGLVKQSVCCNSQSTTAQESPKASSDCISVEEHKSLEVETVSSDPQEFSIQSCISIEQEMFKGTVEIQDRKCIAGSSFATTSQTINNKTHEKEVVLASKERSRLPLTIDTNEEVCRPIVLAKSAYEMPTPAKSFVIVNSTDVYGTPPAACVMRSSGDENDFEARGDSVGSCNHTNQLLSRKKRTQLASVTLATGNSSNTASEQHKCGDLLATLEKDADRLPIQSGSLPVTAMANPILSDCTIRAKNPNNVQLAKAFLPVASATISWPTKSGASPRQKDDTFETVLPQNSRTSVASFHPYETDDLFYLLDSATSQTSQTFAKENKAIGKVFAGRLRGKCIWQRKDAFFESPSRPATAESEDSAWNGCEPSGSKATVSTATSYCVPPWEAKVSEEQIADQALVGHVLSNAATNVALSGQASSNGESESVSVSASDPDTSTLQADCATINLQDVTDKLFTSDTKSVEMIEIDSADERICFRQLSGVIFENNFGSSTINHQLPWWRRAAWNGVRPQLQKDLNIVSAGLSGMGTLEGTHGSDPEVIVIDDPSLQSSVGLVEENWTFGPSANDATFVSGTSAIVSEPATMCNFPVLEIESSRDREDKSLQEREIAGMAHNEVIQSPELETHPSVTPENTPKSYSAVFSGFNAPPRAVPVRATPPTNVLKRMRGRGRCEGSLKALFGHSQAVRDDRSQSSSVWNSYGENFRFPGSDGSYSSDGVPCNMDDSLSPVYCHSNNEVLVCESEGTSVVQRSISSTDYDQFVVDMRKRQTSPSKPSILDTISRRADENLSIDESRRFSKENNRLARERRPRTITGDLSSLTKGERSADAACFTSEEEAQLTAGSSKSETFALSCNSVNQRSQGRAVAMKSKMSVDFESAPATQRLSRDARVPEVSRIVKNGDADEISILAFNYMEQKLEDTIVDKTAKLCEQPGALFYRPTINIFGAYDYLNESPVEPTIKSGSYERNEKISDISGANCVKGGSEATNESRSNIASLTPKAQVRSDERTITNDPAQALSVGDNSPVECVEVPEALQQGQAGVAPGVSSQHREKGNEAPDERLSSKATDYRRKSASDVDKITTISPTLVEDFERAEKLLNDTIRSFDYRDEKATICHPSRIAKNDSRASFLEGSSEVKKPLRANALQDEQSREVDVKEIIAISPSLVQEFEKAQNLLDATILSFGFSENQTKDLQLSKKWKHIDRKKRLNQKAKCPAKAASTGQCLSKEKESATLKSNIRAGITQIHKKPSFKTSKASQFGGLPPLGPRSNRHQPSLMVAAISSETPVIPQTKNTDCNLDSDEVENSDVTVLHSPQCEVIEACLDETERDPGKTGEEIEIIFVEDSFMSTDSFSYGELKGIVFDWIRKYPDPPQMDTICQDATKERRINNPQRLFRNYHLCNDTSAVSSRYASESKLKQEVISVVSFEDDFRETARRWYDASRVFRLSKKSNWTQNNDAKIGQMANIIRRPSNSKVYISQETCSAADPPGRTVEDFIERIDQRRHNSEHLDWSSSILHIPSDSQPNLFLPTLSPQESQPSEFCLKSIQNQGEEKEWDTEVWRMKRSQQVINVECQKLRSGLSKAHIQGQERMQNSADLEGKAFEYKSDRHSVDNAKIPSKSRIERARTLLASRSGPHRFSKFAARKASLRSSKNQEDHTATSITDSEKVFARTNRFGVEKQKIGASGVSKLASTTMSNELFSSDLNMCNDPSKSRAHLTKVNCTSSIAAAARQHDDLDPVPKNVEFWRDDTNPLPTFMSEANGSMKGDRLDRTTKSIKSGLSAEETEIKTSSLLERDPQNISPCDTRSTLTIPLPEDLTKFLNRRDSDCGSSFTFRLLAGDSSMESSKKSYFSKRMATRNENRSVRESYESLEQRAKRLHAILSRGKRLLRSKMNNSPTTVEDEHKLISSPAEEKFDQHFEVPVRNERFNDFGSNSEDEGGKALQSLPSKLFVDIRSVTVPCKAETSRSQHSNPCRLSLRKKAKGPRESDRCIVNINPTSPDIVTTLPFTVRTTLPSQTYEHIRPPTSPRTKLLSRARHSILKARGSTKYSPMLPSTPPTPREDVNHHVDSNAYENLVRAIQLRKTALGTNEKPDNAVVKYPSSPQGKTDLSNSISKSTDLIKVVPKRRLHKSSSRSLAQGLPHQAKELYKFAHRGSLLGEAMAKTIDNNSSHTATE